LQRSLRRRRLVRQQTIKWRISTNPFICIYVCCLVRSSTDSFLSLSHTLSITHSFSHNLCNTQTNSHLHTNTITLILSLSHSQTNSHLHSNTVSLSLTHTMSLSHTNTYLHSNTVTHAHSKKSKTSTLNLAHNLLHILSQHT
jgi:hypothetical protein